MRLADEFLRCGNEKHHPGMRPNEVDAELIGYPKGAGGRAFGMAATALPKAGGYVLVIVLMVVGSDPCSSNWPW